MVRAKTIKLVVNTYGNYLGMQKGSYILRDKHGKTERYEQFVDEIGEVQLCSGNTVSTGALVSFAFWEVDVLLMKRNGEPIATIKPLDSEEHVETRIAQYKALENGKGLQIAKQLVSAKIRGQNSLLQKYELQTDLKPLELVERLNDTNLKALRKKLLHLEGKFSEFYFKQIFALFPEKLRPKNRITFHAVDGLNNTFNVAYRLLFWKCYRALYHAHLECYLGFLHSLEYTRPSLVCDLQELYRYLVDGFLIDYCQTLKPKDFGTKTETWNGKKAKRIYLRDWLTKNLTNSLNDYFRRKVDLPRICHGRHQELETLVNEESLLLAKYLRDERETWIPRIAVMQ